MRRNSYFQALQIVLAMQAVCNLALLGQAASPAPLPGSPANASSVQIPLQATDLHTLRPAKNLSVAGLHLDIDGEPRAFQLSSAASEPLNLLLIVPLGAPVNRQRSIEQLIDALRQTAAAGWNISILDDNGDQTPFTRDSKSVVAALEKIRAAENSGIALDDWRETAALAIAGMRDLAGRRVVLALGDIFHERIFEDGDPVYENFAIDDVAGEARNAGAVIYAADSTEEVHELRALSPIYSLTGAGPWLLLDREDHPAGWITDTAAETLSLIQHNGAGAYLLALNIPPKQMDGQLHVLSVTPTQPGILLNAPPYYIAPDLAQLRQLAALTPGLRQALRHPSITPASPLTLATQLAYFPHADGRAGTQIATTGFLWSQPGNPAAALNVALELEQTSSGFVTDTMTGRLDWSSAMPTWNVALTVSPGAYRLRVAAADSADKIRAAASTRFTVEPSGGEPVLISSLVLGASCVFAPPAPNTKAIDYLQAGSCDLRPDATHAYLPTDVIWTLVRVTPVGKLAGRPAGDWKANFEIVEAAGKKIAQMPVRWLPAQDGSFIATTAFPLANLKHPLVDGEYAVVFRLKGPGIEPNYGEDAPFVVYGSTEQVR